MDEWGISKEIEEGIVLEKKKVTSIWDVMNSSITKKIKPTIEEKKKISEFMFQRLLARFEKTLPFALMFTTKNIPVEFQWQIIDIFVPKGFIPFEKQNKKQFNSSIENLMKYYKCNERIAKEYLELMPEEEIEKINEKYKKGKL